MFTAASTEKVPLPCIGTQTCFSAAFTMAISRSRTRAVTALKLLSHDPQSRSIALLVASDVVSGPGVSRMGSRSRLLIYAVLVECVLAKFNNVSLRQAFATPASAAAASA